MVCPDCLETVAVEVAGLLPPADQCDEELPLPTQATPEPTQPEPSSDEDEFRLSEPTALPRPECLEQGTGGRGRPPTRCRTPAAGTVRFPGPGKASGCRPGAAADSARRVSHQVQCLRHRLLRQRSTRSAGPSRVPIAYSLVHGERPVDHAKPVVDVMKDDDGGRSFQLSEPIDRIVFKDVGGKVRTVARWAAAPRQGRRRTATSVNSQRPKLPRQPLWSGVFRFLPYVRALLVLPSLR